MTAPRIAAILIGRNEGARLLACLASVKDLDRVVYVDSGSTDGSVEAARAAGAEVVALDMSKPFTAARARNAGIEALKQGKTPDLVQFIDGDCELQPGWIATAQAFLIANPQAAVACGRRRERFPEASIYNRLCDFEWDT
ncbi:MAG: glycosyltransferase family A protein, partial [Pseudomonadota bacterium]|nr:glycosyltransferase family A protein [Pseudomonadota bacterium]